MSGIRLTYSGVTLLKTVPKDATMLKTVNQDASDGHPKASLQHNLPLVARNFSSIRAEANENDSLHINTTGRS